jgi:chromosome segregation ATPase|mmetsp:Transcript_49056/g.76559  ORF Transcript_49056/g.76559 Transcript_49056/m.76559 type:complete len:738 (-) Transcript_49056:95-2308(-)
MQFHALACVLLVASANGAATATADHPIGKVITLLQDLMEKVVSEGKTEEVSYAKFVYWCKTSMSEMDGAIKEDKETIDSLESTIDAKTTEVTLFKETITKLEDEIMDLQLADKTATDDDKSRNALYLEKKKDLEDTIKAMADAITALKDAQTTTDSKLFLSQHKFAQTRIRDIFALIATVASEKEEHSLMNFVQEIPIVPAALVQNAAPFPAAPVWASGDYEAHVKKYSFKSDNVIELLKGLQLKFEDELTEANKAETNAQNAYALSKNARDAALKATEESKKQKETDLSDAEGTLASAQGDLKDEKDDLKADTATFDATKENCANKKLEWEERSSIRKQEHEAMEAAVKILSKVSGVPSEAPENPGLPAAPVKDALLQKLSFMQTSEVSSPQARAVELLRETAKKHHSKALEALAAQISVHAPKMFQDIINSIEKMIFRLKQEQVDEDNHKAWCDMEVAKTNSSIDNKKDKAAELEAKIQEANTKVVTLTEDIKAANKMINDIKVFQEEATEIRTVGKKENALAIKDATEAQKAITNAMAVLTSFYKETGMITKEPWEFLQEPVQLPENPATWEGSYTGVADPKTQGTGVIAVLEAVSSDFAKMEANTRAQEAADAKEYEDTMKTHSIELARRSKEEEMKGAEKKRLTEKITALTSQKKHVTDELDTTEQYYKDLMPACITGDSTYLDRKAARDAEIGALVQAEKDLENWEAGAPAPPAALMQAPAPAFLQAIARH